MRLVRCGFTDGKPPMAAGGLVGAACLCPRGLMAITRKAHKIGIGVAVCGSLLGLTFIWCYVSSNHLSRQHYERIKKGMTANEVEEILGMPSSEHSASIYVAWISDDPKYTTETTCVWEKCWFGGEINVWVDFDSQGLVLRKEMNTFVDNHEKNWLAVIRTWLRSVGCK